MLSSKGIRTLQLAMDHPWPADSGGDIRNAFIARSAALLGPVHIISLGAVGSSSLPIGISASQPPGFHDHNPWTRHDAALRTQITLTPADLSFIAAELARFKPDVAILEGVAVTQAQPLFLDAGIPHVLDMHNVESDLFRSHRSSKSVQRYLKDILFGALRWRDLYKLDRDASRAASETWVVSQLDQLRLRQIDGAASTVIANPLPDARMFDLQLDRTRYETPAAIFIGHLAYPPNIAAARELALKIWPAVRAKNPDARLTIAGRSPVASVRSLAGAQGLSLLSNPTDLTPLASDHGYAAMPIRSGGGTRIKALEAMAAGLVVIATSKAVEGLGLQPGTHYLRAENTADFVSHLSRCCRNPELALEIVGRARHFANDHFHPERLARRVAERLAGLGALATARIQTSSG